MAVGLIQMTVTVGAPAVLDGREGRWVLADFYCALLGMEVIRQDWLKVAKHSDSPFQLALDGDGWSDQRPPRWGDPEHPQQMHLDVLVPDVGAAGGLAEDMGALLLQDGDGHQVYADPAGHPSASTPTLQPATRAVQAKSGEWSSTAMAPGTWRRSTKGFSKSTGASRTCPNGSYST